LLLVTAVNSYLSFDRSHIFQIAHVDFVFQFSTLRIHHVLPPEQSWRDQVAERETIEQWFENRRMQIDRDVQREPWDTPAYHAALARFRDWRTVYDVYQKSLKPLGTWKESGVVVPLVWLMIPEAVLPSLAIYLWWRRWRQRIRRAIGRHIRYVPYAQLTGFQRLRRVTVVTASAFCSLLAVATTVLWVRSYWVGDAYSQLMVVGLSEAEQVGAGFHRRSECETYSCDADAAETGHGLIAAAFCPGGFLFTGVAGNPGVASGYRRTLVRQCSIALLAFCVAFCAAARGVASASPAQRAYGRRPLPAV
jgi:hypothetical protein